MNFALTPELQALQARVRRFIADEIVPPERDPRWGDHGPSDDSRLEPGARAEAWRVSHTDDDAHTKVMNRGAAQLRSKKDTY